MILSTYRSKTNGDEFYAIIKLTSGEEILSLISIDDNEDPLILLQNPITIKVIHTPNGMHVKVKSWIELSSDDIFIIKNDNIITMTETKDERLIEIYKLCYRRRFNRCLY